MNRTGFFTGMACSAVFAFAAGFLCDPSWSQEGAPSSPAPAAPPATAQLAADGAYSPSYFAIPENFRHSKLSSQSTEAVGTRLVCLFDISGSVDNREYEVQLEAMASAIGSDDFRDSIFFEGGPESIAICVVDFGTTSDLRIPWVDIRKGDDVKLKLLASEIRGLQRREHGLTNHGSALEFAELCLTNCPWPARRSVVDLITDGAHNSGPAPLPFVDRLAKQGATINALITTTSQEPNLERWVRRNILTPPGSKDEKGREIDAGFVKIVATQESTRNPGAIVEYHQAMAMAFRRKLILEVASIDLDDLRRAIAASHAGAQPPLMRGWTAPSPGP